MLYINNGEAHQSVRDAIVRENTNKNAYKIEFSSYVYWNTAGFASKESAMNIKFHVYINTLFLVLNDGYIFYCVLSTMLLINAFPVLNHYFRLFFIYMV